ncbi:hypothetical protein BD779DRAFT_1382497, partial [Infundibulicybe gibba]
LHKGHCYVDRTSGHDNHRRLNHPEMTLWAKKIALGQATIYNPPNCLSFDRAPDDWMARPLSPSPAGQREPTPSPNAEAPSPFVLGQPRVSFFPSVYEVIQWVDACKPNEGYGELTEVLFEAGISASEQILLIPEDVLCVIGDMGTARARILRNYTKRVILPRLGIFGNFDE